MNEDKVEKMFADQFANVNLIGTMARRLKDVIFRLAAITNAACGGNPETAVEVAAYALIAAKDEDAIILARQGFLDALDAADANVDKDDEDDEDTMI